MSKPKLSLPKPKRATPARGSALGQCCPRRPIACRTPSRSRSQAPYILGLLHDIGRRAGVTGMRHVIDGYTFLHDLGYDHAARIALTHSFPYQHPQSVFGEWDCTEAEFAMLSTALLGITYDDYDRLLQLCDALALPEGFCLIEKRLIDVFMRYAQQGVGPEVHTKFQQVFAIQHRFEAIIGCSIYRILPGVVETTFR
ncbi:MAG: HD domain-containing protein [Caldilineaceae bacterium]